MPGEIPRAYFFAFQSTSRLDTPLITYRSTFSNDIQCPIQG